MRKGNRSYFYIGLTLMAFGLAILLGFLGTFPVCFVSGLFGACAVGFNLNILLGLIIMVMGFILLIRRK